MKKDFALTIVIISLLLLSAIAHATVWYVHPDSALNSIQGGLDSCLADDTVLVGPSIYYENLVWPEVDNIVLISEYGPDTTIIDGNNSGNVILIDEVEVDPMIGGFTIRDGIKGICSDAEVTIINNIIANNTDTGICCHDCVSRIFDNIVTGNAEGIFSHGGDSSIIAENIVTGNTGNGIDCGGSERIITGNTITENTGNGIYCGGGASQIITGNTITGNTGTGILCDWFCSAIITENTITENQGVGISLDQAYVQIIDNTITDNESHGISVVFNSYPVIERCTIARNKGNGIHVGRNYNTFEIHYNDIIDNTGYGVWNDFWYYIVHAQMNWWGDVSGPGGFGPGTGDEVSPYVDFDPWLTAPFGVEEEECTQNIFTDLQISPNPFHDRVNIRFGMDDGKRTRDDISLRIFNISGRMVKEFNQPVSPIIWRGIDNNGNKVPNGVYLLKFTVDDHTETEKLILLRSGG